MAALSPYLLWHNFSEVQHKDTTRWEDGELNVGGWITLDVMDGCYPGDFIGWHQWPGAHAHHSIGRGTKPQIRAGLKEAKTSPELCCWRPPWGRVSPFNSRILWSVERLRQKYSYRISSNGIVDSRWVQFSCMNRYFNAFKTHKGWTF